MHRGRFDLVGYKHFNYQNTDLVRRGRNALVPTLWFQRFGDLGSLCRDAYMEHDLQQRNSDPPFLGANDVRWRCNGLRYDCHASGA